jgi:hypothetical protein
VVSADDVCLLCGRHELVEYGTVKSHLLIRCSACGFIRATMVAENQLAGFYEQEYFEGQLAYGYGRVGATKTDQIAEPLETAAAWIMARLLDPLDPQAIIEIGPGLNGGWIKYFRRYQTRRLQCVEISALASERLNAAGIQTFKGCVEDFHCEKLFDLALAVEVLEHVADHVSFVTTIMKLLVPGGHLFLTTGNSRSVTAKRSKLEWYYLDPPAHLSYFDDRNIVQLLRRGGFDQVSVHRIGFKWIELAFKYRLTAALPLLHALNYTSGMFVLAHKANPIRSQTAARPDIATSVAQ